MLNLVYETLYSSDNLSSISMNNNLLSLLDSIQQSYSNTIGKVKITIDTGNIVLDISQATPLGLIINELVSNSFKYAFDNKKEGQINLQLTESGQDIVMIYSDDSTGMPKDFDWYSTKSLGLNLVKLLSENQLNGSIELVDDKGVRFVVRFSPKESK